MSAERVSYLDPECYDRAEKKAMAVLPNRIIECCQPSVFQWEGYPSRVESVAAMRRYIDVMHEGRLSATFNDILGGGITGDEMDLMKEVSLIVRRLSESHFGGAIVPKDALTRALNIYRQIRILYPDPKRVVFEVGGGSGYVGALLVLSGYAYVATDVTQAFYLFQNQLMNAVAPGKVIELASDPRSFTEINEIPQGWAVHIPWWKFVLPEPNFPLAVDVVTASHCLCELHPRALAYTLKVCSHLLDNKGLESCFLYEGYGSTVRNPIWSVCKRFADLGFGIAHNDTLASVWVRTSSPNAVGGVTLPMPHTFIAPPDRLFTSARTLGRTFRNFVNVRYEKNKSQPTLESQKSEISYHPPIWITPENPLSKRIMDGRALNGQAVKYGVTDLEAMLKEIHGKSDISTDDEKFLRYIETYL